MFMKFNFPLCSIRYVQENIHFHEMEPMYRQFHRILEAFKITEKKEDIKEEKDAPKLNKPQEKVQDQFAADEEAVEVRLFFICINCDILFITTSRRYCKYIKFVFIFVFFDSEYFS